MMPKLLARLAAISQDERQGAVTIHLARDFARIVQRRVVEAADGERVEALGAPPDGSP